MARSVKCLPCKSEDLWIPSTIIKTNSGVKGGGGGVGDRQILRAFWLDTVKRSVIMGLDGLKARSTGCTFRGSESDSQHSHPEVLNPLNAATL